jgi:glutathione S-transferase
MLALYHNDMSVCAQKVRVVLAEKGLDWESRHMNLRLGETLTPEYLKLNPGGVVPTLLHDGRVVIESTVICEYLDDAFPTPALRPTDAFERANMRLWTKQLDEGVHASTGAISVCIAFRHQHLKRDPKDVAAYLAKIPQADRRDRVRLGIEKGMDAPQFAPAIHRFIKLLKDIEAALEVGPWLAGSTYSLADVGYTPYAWRLEHLGLGFLFGPRTADWAGRLKARPSFATAMEKWVNAGYLELFDQHRDQAQAKVRQLLTA